MHTTVRRLRNERVLSLVLLILAISVWLGVMRTFGLDDSFITYRYARNVAAGVGLVYNPGEMVLSTTAPLYALFLAALSLVIPDLPFLGGLLGAIGIGVGGVLLVDLLPVRARWLRVWGGVTYVLASPLWLALGMETPLWIALVMGAIALVWRDRWVGGGLLIGLAVLTRPDAALPGVLLSVAVLLAGRHGSTWRERLRPVLTYILVGMVPVALFYGWVWISYGSPIPATLSAKRAQAVLGITGFSVGTGVFEGLRLIVTSLLRQSPLYVVFGLAMLGGVAQAAVVATKKRWRLFAHKCMTERLWQAFPALLLVGWGLLHLLAYTVMRIAPYQWYYAPLLPGAIVLAAAGIDLLAGGGGYFRRVPAFSAALLITVAQVSSLVAIADCIENGNSTDPILPSVNWAVYRETGEWLDANTPPEAVIGVAEVGQIGFYAQRTMTDSLGLLQPETGAALQRGDVLAWLPAQFPDYLVFQRFREERLLIYNISVANNPWFRASYQPAAEFDDPRYATGPVTVFERVTEVRPLVESGAVVDFGPLQLVGVATDGRNLPVSSGKIPVRVRLDWTQVDVLPDAVRIVVTPLDVEDTIPADTVYAAGRWTGHFSTWHTLLLNAPSTSGGVPILVEVAGGGDSLGMQTVGWLDVSFPQGEAPHPAAPTFYREQSALLRLVEGAVMVEKRQLTAQLVWYVVQPIGEDYAYFAHLRREGEETLVAQADGIPLAWRYPTYLWDAGEVVPMEIDLDIPTDVPGRYTLVAGWYLPGDGTRLVLLAGDPPKMVSDFLSLADVRIMEDGTVTITQLLEPNCGDGACIGSDTIGLTTPSWTEPATLARIGHSYSAEDSIKQ